MGLLDTPGDIDPRTQGLLALGLGMLNSRGNFGQGIAQGGMQGLAAFNDARQQQQRTALAQQQAQHQAMQMQQAQLQMAEMQRAAKEAEMQRGRDDQFRQMIPSPMAGIGGPPTVENAAAQPPVDPYQQQLYQAMKLGQIKPMDYLSATKKDTAPTKLAAGEGLYQKSPDGTFKPLIVNPKEDSTPSDWKLFELSGAKARGVSFDQWDLGRKRAGANSVYVNTGQHGFDNEMKLGDKFKGEPIYKAYQEVQSAHSQITQAIKMANPIGDLTAATKIMKILDPGSVVRESELGLAMAATGALDRVTNFASMIVSGHKLTPKQRGDFQSLANSLLNESAQLYNAKRSEYDKMGSDWGLNSGRVIGKPATTPFPIVKTDSGSSIDDLLLKYGKK